MTNKKVQLNIAGAPKCVPIRIGQNSYRALIDTGAEICLINEKTFEKLKPKREIVDKNINLQTAGGESLTVVGQTMLEFKLADTKFVHPFIVIRNLNRNIIIGGDFMEKQGVRIYYDLKQVRVGTRYLPYQNDEILASLIRARKDVILKPNSATIFETTLKKSVYFQKEDQIEIIPPDKGWIKGIEPEVTIVPCLTHVANKTNVPVLVTNNSNKTFRIRRGCVVGQVSTVQKVSLVSNRAPVSNQENKVSDQVNLKEIQTPQNKRRLVENLVNRHNTVFASSDQSLTGTDTVTMKIETGDTAPIKLKPYKTPLTNREVIGQAVDEMLKNGIIQRSQSPYAFPVVIVEKKDQTKRFCVDFRKLNEVTKKMSWPLPLIDDILSRLGKAKHYSSFDCRSGYWQLKLDPESRHKASFVCHRGQYEFVRVPFGLVNAPSMFMMLMNEVLEGMEDFTQAYLDDIIVFSETEEEHIKHIEAVFDRLNKHNLKLKLKKCKFFQKEIEYLGFKISQSGISPNPDKVQAIRSMPPPTTVKEVRSFIGMISFYRRFVPDFSEIAEPLIALTRKFARFNWTESCQRSFELLKEKLSYAPLLVYPDINKPYILYTDASDKCIGACLAQEVEGPEGVEQKPIYFLSHKLSKTQMKWPIIEKEAYAIHYALGKLHHYLHGAQFVINTDHKPLQYLLTSEMQNRKVQMWALAIAGYNCTIQYIPGKNNYVADMLSRRPEQRVEEEEDSTAQETVEEHDHSYEINVINSNKVDPKQYANYEQLEDSEIEIPKNPMQLENFNMMDEQNKDNEITQIIAQLHKEEAPKKVKDKYLLIDQVLHYLSGGDAEPKVRLVIPKHLISRVIQQYHDHNGHMGIHKTYATISQKYYWPNSYRDMVTYINGCIPCQQRNLQAKQVPMQEMTLAPYPFAKVSIDISGPYPKSISGNKYIIGFIDHYSGWPEAFASPDKTPESVLTFLLNDVIPAHGCPLQIVTDNGGEFVNKKFRDTLQELNIHHVTTSVYRPQSNGKIERCWRSIHDIMSKTLDEDHLMWDTVLNQCLAAIRVSVSDATGFSPFFLLYNRDPVLPLDNILRPRQKYLGDDFHMIALQNQHKNFRRVHKNLKKQQKKNIRLANKNKDELGFQVGDPVYLKKHVRKSKLDPKWTPFYRIVEQISPVTFKIKNQLNQTEQVTHASHLRKVKVGDWNIPENNNPQVRPTRKTRLAVSDDQSSVSSGYSAANEDSDDTIIYDAATLPVAGSLRRERQSSSDDEDIPVKELQRMKVLFPQKSERKNTNPVEQDATISDHVEKMDYSSVMSVESTDSKVKKLLLALLDCL